MKNEKAKPCRTGFRSHLLAAAGVAILALAPLASASAEDGPLVNVTGGQVQGTSWDSGSGAVFKGIPFAAPPIGALRWREPQAVKPWHGVLKTVDYAPACAQAAGERDGGLAPGSSEDCLYLNVWAPSWPVKGKMPVMVWLYGGANVGGNSSGRPLGKPGDARFDGANLASHGVIVVTLGYRVGLFGFLGHPELTAESPHHASGGYGLLDQIAALHWVHDNIRKFGGDPSNVTLFGQSAGSQDTSILLQSPLTKGLIEKAIMESGTPMIGDRKLQTPAQTAHLGEILAKLLGAPKTGQIAFLRNLPADRVFTAYGAFRKEVAAENLVFDVGMDGYAVPKFAPNVYRLGHEPKLPVIIGSNALDAPGYMKSAAQTPDAQWAYVRQRVQIVYGVYPDLLPRAETIYGLVPGGEAPSTYSPYRTIDWQYATDLDFRCEGDVLADWHSAIAPTWRYEFTANTPKHPAYHGAEIALVFGHLSPTSPAPQLASLSPQMQGYWINFAKTGNPNGSGLPEWTPYDAVRRHYVEFSNEDVLAKQNLRGEACDLYKEKFLRDVEARKD